MDFTPLFNAILTLLGVILTTYLIPLLKTKLTTDQLKKVREIVDIAVAAAEMLFKEGGSGAAKKEWVIKYLESHGVDVDDAQINALIESAVYELKKN